MSDDTWDSPAGMPGWAKRVDDAGHRIWKKPRKQRRRRDAIGGIAGNLLVLAIANLWPFWLPWTYGVVTNQWPTVLWAVNLAAGITIGGNLALLVWRGRMVHHAAGLVMSAATLISTAAMYTVYPFELARLAGPWLDALVHILLLVCLVITGIGVIVWALRFLWAALQD